MTAPPNSIVRIASVEIGNALPLTLIAGPCQLESREHALEMASALKGIAGKAGVGLVYKTSFDKANRTSAAGKRGLGFDRSLPIFAEIRERLGVPVLTDVHEREQCAAVAEAVDVLQIPAFLCRQTDLLIAAAQTGRAVNVKKGQFLAPWDMRHAVEKIRESGNERVFLTERGSSFGYNNLVVDMRSLVIMRRLAPVVFDATHSVQLPSAGAGENGKPQQSGGQPEFIPILSRAAVAVGVDGVFMEVHDNPALAKSDGANALPLSRLRETLQELLAVHQSVHTRSS